MNKFSYPLSTNRNVLTKEQMSKIGGGTEYYYGCVMTCCDVTPWYTAYRESIPLEPWEDCTIDWCKTDVDIYATVCGCTCDWWGNPPQN